MMSKRFAVACMQVALVGLGGIASAQGAEERTLLVRVLDHEGTPWPDVPVVVKRAYRGPVCAHTVPRTLWTGRTGDDGRATVECRVGVSAEEAREDGVVSGYVRVSAGHALGAVASARVDVDAMASGEELTLRLEQPVGTAVVVVRTPEGAAAVGARVELSASSEPSRWWIGRRPDAVDGEGRLELFGLPPRETLSLHVRDEDDAFEPFSAPFATPAVDGGSVEVALAFPSRRTEFVGRATPGADVVFVPDGAPDHAWWNADDLEDEQGKAAASDGTFAVRVPPHVRPRSGGALVVIGRPKDERGRPDPGRSWLRIARVPLPRPWPGGEVDLGTIQLEDAPVLAAGTVVDDTTGAPAPSVTVHVAGDVPDGEGDTDRIRLRSRTDDRGRFVLRGPAVPGDWRIEATAGQWVRELSGRFEPGARDLEVRFVPMPEIAFRVELPVGADPDEVRVSIDFPSWTSTWSSLRRGGTLAAEAEGPGRYEIELTSGIGGPPLARRSFEITERGELRGLPSVIELDPDVHLATLNVYSSTGISAREVDVCSLSEDGTSVGHWSARRGRATLMFRGPDLLVRVHAPGHRVEPVRLVPGAQDVVLRPALKVRLRVVGDPPRGSWGLHPSVAFADASRDERLPWGASRGLNGRHVAGADGCAELELPLATTYIVTVHAESATAAGTPRPVSQAHVIDVADSDAVQTFEIPLDTALVREAVAKAGER